MQNMLTFFRNPLVVQDARQNNALSRSILSISIGGLGYKPLDDALEAAMSSGLTVIAASSNFGRDAMQSQEHGHLHVLGVAYLVPYA